MAAMRIAESKWVQNIDNWLKLRSQRERVMVLGGAILAVTILWFSLWENMYQTSQKSFREDRQSLEEKIVSFKAQNKAMQSIINSVVLAQKRDQLTKDLKLIDAQLEAVSTQLVSPKELATALKNILAQTHGLVLLSLSNSSNTLLTPNNLPDASKPSSNSSMISDAHAATPASLVAPQDSNKQPLKLYQHEFTLEFDGDFFSVLRYLKKLENSSYRFYGDSLDYAVSEYPRAKIVLKVHTISKGKDLIND